MNISVGIFWEQIIYLIVELFKILSNFLFRISFSQWDDVHIPSVDLSSHHEQHDGAWYSRTIWPWHVIWGHISYQLSGKNDSFSDQKHNSTKGYLQHKLLYKCLKLVCCTDFEFQYENTLQDDLYIRLALLSSVSLHTLSAVSVSRTHWILCWNNHVLFNFLLGFSDQPPAFGDSFGFEFQSHCTCALLHEAESHQLCFQHHHHEPACGGCASESWPLL